MKMDLGKDVFVIVVRGNQQPPPKVRLAVPSQTQRAPIFVGNYRELPWRQRCNRLGYRRRHSEGQSCNALVPLHRVPGKDKHLLQEIYGTIPWPLVPRPLTIGLPSFTEDSTLPSRRPLAPPPFVAKVHIKNHKRGNARHLEPHPQPTRTRVLGCPLPQASRTFQGSPPLCSKASNSVHSTGRPAPASPCPSMQAAWVNYNSASLFVVTPAALSVSTPGNSARSFGDFSGQTIY